MFFMSIFFFRGKFFHARVNFFKVANLITCVHKKFSWGYFMFENGSMLHQACLGRVGRTGSVKREIRMQFIASQMRSLGVHFTKFLLS